MKRSYPEGAPRHKGTKTQRKAANKHSLIAAFLCVLVPLCLGAPLHRSRVNFVTVIPKLGTKLLMRRTNMDCEKELAAFIRNGVLRRPVQAIGHYFQGSRASCALG